MRATDALFGRLTTTDVDTVLGALDSEDRALLNQLEPDPAAYKQAIIHLGVHYGVSNVLEKTGLTAAAPPDDVHSMGRGKIAAGGSSYYADLVLDALASARVELPAGARILDFGSSSGRVIRVIKAYEPGFQCYGCDPNKGAILWAKANLPTIDFAVSPLRPPLPYGTHDFDLVFAISIWSHLDRLVSRWWLEEMRRIVKPGGYFILTFHGMHSLRYYEAQGLRDPGMIQKLANRLRNHGFAFFNSFGPAGDWGVKDRKWGEAYLTPRWLSRNTEPAWELRYFAAGLVEGNQDIAVLKAAG